MTDENVIPAVSQHNDDKKKGQMLVIYLPEGSVILDRTNIDESDFPDGVLTAQAGTVITAPVITAPVITAPVITAPVAPVAPVAPLAPVELPIFEQPRPVAPLYVAPIETPISEQPRPVVPSVTQFEIPMPQYQHETLAPLPHRRMHLRRKYRISWMHSINSAFIVVITMSAIIPALLSSLFGMAIYAAKTSAPNSLIYRGDVMVSQIMPVFELNANDVVLVRNSNTWNLAIREIASKTMRADMTTITSSSGSSPGQIDTYVFKSLTPVHKVTRVIPKFGYGLMVVTSIAVKVALGFGLIVMNILIHWRRARNQRRYYET